MKEKGFKKHIVAPTVFTYGVLFVPKLREIEMEVLKII